MSAPTTTSSDRPLKASVAVVTGASSGVGRAITVSLAQQGATVCAVGRNPATLSETITEAQCYSRVLPFQADLAMDVDVGRLEQMLVREFGRLDILVHSAGVIHPNPMERARIEDLDLQYATNVRVPYLVTQRLLPFLTSARGQIVFINSSAGLMARQPEIGQYGATKHALKAIADSLRAEVNPKGIRLLTVYLGRTATPMQKAIHQYEGRVYYPEKLLQPEDVASVIVHALMLPSTAEVTDISIRPMMRT